MPLGRIRVELISDLMVSCFFCNVKPRCGLGCAVMRRLRKRGTNKLIIRRTPGCLVAAIVFTCFLVHVFCVLLPLLGDVLHFDVGLIQW